MSEAVLRELERRRCEAIVATRLDTLDALIADDLVHIHAVGYADDKPSYLAGLRDRLDVRSVHRDPPAVRIIDDVAVMTGTLVNVVSPRGRGEWREAESLVTQLWRREAAGWTMFHYHATRRHPAGEERP